MLAYDIRSLILLSLFLQFSTIFSAMYSFFSSLFFFGKMKFKNLLIQLADS